MKVRVRKLRVTNFWTWICPRCFQGRACATHAEALDRAMDHIQSIHIHQKRG